MINLHLPWMAKNAFNIFPIGIAVSYIFQFLLISTKCHNPLENHGRNEHHIFFIFTWVFSRDFALNVEGNAKGCRLAQKGFSTPGLVILDFDEHDFHDLVKKTV